MSGRITPLIQPGNTTGEVGSRLLSSNVLHEEICGSGTFFMLSQGLRMIEIFRTNLQQWGLFWMACFCHEGNILLLETLIRCYMYMQMALIHHIPFLSKRQKLEEAPKWRNVSLVPGRPVEKMWREHLVL